MKLPFISRSAGTSTKKALPKIELVFDEGGTKALAFGLLWKTIATAGGREAAVKIARDAGASQFVYRGQQVGMGLLEQDAAAAGTRIFPAAVIAARQHVGTSVCALRVGDAEHGEYWIAVTANGAPTSTDEFHAGVDDAFALDRVRQLLEQFSNAGSLTVYTNIDGHGINDARAYGPTDMLAATLGVTDLLGPVPKAAVSIPKPVLVLGIVAVALLGAQSAYKWWDKRKQAQLAAMNAAGEQDPAQAWAQAISNWEATTTSSSGAGLLQARESLDRLPVQWDGWVLSTAACRAAPINTTASPPNRSWTCQASYVRQPVGVFNREMEHKLPADWKVAFTPLNNMQVSWNFVQGAQPIKIASLRPANYYKVEVVSRLQQLSPALAGEVNFAFVPVQIPAPKKADGTVMPPTPAAEGLALAAITVKAPLRSIDALIKADIEADWRELVIVYDNQGPKWTIKGSALMAEAKGDMYAKN